MTDLGYTCLLFAFIVSAYAIIASLIERITGEERFLKSAENAVLSVCFLVTFASAGLIYAFISDNFQIEYVASYSSRHLPLFYKLSGFWAGQAGSLLFWEWFLSIFAAAVVLTNQKKNRQFLSWVICVIMATSMFLVSVLVFVSNPFAKLSFLPPDGRGLNPLLRNIGMVFHPPTLFLGYVGYAIPFAFFIAALLAGEWGKEWLKTVRVWSLFSWFFLGIGNLLGAAWAYVELGWGGYWAWDPVENASFMPWLLGTASLHSLMVQEKKGMFKIWNFILVVLTFVFTVFGTFIVRSGILSSVHAFAKSPLLGGFFLGFILLILLFSFVVAIIRRGTLKSSGQIESFVSRESSSLLTNLIFVASTFAIVWGTIFPMLTAAFKGQQVTVGAAFFNQVNLPIFLFLLLITGICPFLAWGKTSLKSALNSFLFPLIAALVGGILLFLFRLAASVYALISLILSIFVAVAVLQEFLRVTLRGRNFLHLIWVNRRRYGALVIHLGMVLVFVGVAGSAFNSVKEVTLRKGEAVEVKGYTFKYEDFLSKEDPIAHINQAILGVYKSEKKIQTLMPEKNYDKSYEQWFAEVAIRTNLKEDLYVILGGADPDGASAGFKIQVNPLVAWIWLGGIVVTLGTVFVFWPEKN